MSFSPSRQQTGWTVEKQEAFLEALAETGSVSSAAARVNMSPRAAYQLRARPEATAFAEGWDNALTRAGGRLLGIAYERALKGGVRRVWKKGELLIEETAPSDRLLAWILSRVGPVPFGPGIPARRMAGPLHDTLPDAPALSFEDMHETPEPPNVLEE
jgi:hypothetical protein